MRDKHLLFFLSMNMPNMQTLIAEFDAMKLIPVVVIDREEDTVPLAQALLRGGCRSIEITFRTAAAPGAIRRIANDVPDMLVGAGTLLTPEQVAQARDAGALFGIAPGFDPTVVAAAKEMGFPFIPGIATASEMAQALTAGCTVQKFFPAQAAGGRALLGGLMAAFGHTGLRIIPTGGINAENIGDWLSVKGVVACGGTWICDATMIREQNWTGIEELTRVALNALKAFTS